MNYRNRIRKESHRNCKQTKVILPGEWFSMLPSGFMGSVLFLLAACQFFYYLYDLLYGHTINFVGNRTFSIILMLGMAGLCIASAIGMSRHAACQIRLLDRQIECFRPFQRRVVLDYDKCTVRINYHIQSGRRFYWITLSYGEPRDYQKSKNPHNGTNSILCQPGFIRMIYRPEVYDALLRVLPPKQRAQLLEELRAWELRTHRRRLMRK